jgi:hypothetical protein
MFPHTRKVRKPQVSHPNYSGVATQAATRTVALPQPTPIAAEDPTEVEPEGVTPEEEGAITKIAPDHKAQSGHQETETDPTTVTSHGVVVSLVHHNLTNAKVVAIQATHAKPVGLLRKIAETAAS